MQFWGTILVQDFPIKYQNCEKSYQYLPNGIKNNVIVRSSQACGVFVSTGVLSATGSYKF